MGVNTTLLHWVRSCSAETSGLNCQQLQDWIRSNTAKYKPLWKKTEQYCICVHSRPQGKWDFSDGKDQQQLTWKPSLGPNGQQVAGPYRLRLHDGKLIKDRRYHLRTYPNCFVAKELTDWLIDHKEAPDRETGIRLMQKLMDHYIIHHVCDEHSDYKDAKLLYRFRKDDGTFPLNKDVKVFMRGQSLHEKLISVEDSILKAREENAVKYQRTFLGCEMIDWLIKEGETANRKEAIELGRALLEHGIIQHVSSRYHFFDSNLLYQFRINFRRRRRLTELLNENSPRALSDSPDSPFCLRKLNPDQGNTSFLSVQPNKEIKLVSAVRRSSVTSLAGSSNPYFSATPSLGFLPATECNPKSVLKRPVTNEELLSPGAPYIKKTLTICPGDSHAKYKR
ncbi:DEP domain-containing mTOR-interacting protein-like isoform X3 [Alligator sinensis]|uniref:DEP domain-containing mTOR-interacting protein-like isoform X3 n=1 Tax=Alligator sinensis TaxID=38654 RepID=A0A3Q0GCX6_ALLSI|nr:DEP domain-containing mTOR-interacting protein-like isoform X3 [Alligator sinensis]